ncbi:MAG: hypothetical protein KC777_01080 [Cyanobacteria bacterium HKST-UBA02]|nr:hypothetical protein [Cyanobacteria bacterium HKST-UBA02]
MGGRHEINHEDRHGDKHADEARSEDRSNLNLLSVQGDSRAESRASSAAQSSAAAETGDQRSSQQLTIDGDKQSVYYHPALPDHAYVECQDFSVDLQATVAGTGVGLGVTGTDAACLDARSGQAMTEGVSNLGQTMNSTAGAAETLSRIGLSPSQLGALKDAAVKNYLEMTEIIGQGSKHAVETMGGERP